DEREVETEHGMRLLRPKRGNPETDYAEAYPTAPPLDSTLLPFVPFVPFVRVGVDEAFAMISRARGFSVPDTEEQREWVKAFWNRRVAGLS
ncbi:MAG: hypothetical protein ABSF26_12075, partial [Thermoguttaceae bacterium]